MTITIPDKLKPKLIWSLGFIVERIEFKLENTSGQTELNGRLGLVKLAFIELIEILIKADSEGLE